VHLLARQASIPTTASPLGEEEPGPEGAERGGYLPIPRREARVGEWVTCDASAEPDRPQRPERPVGSESLSVRDGVSSDEQSETVCEEREKCSRRRGGDDEAGGVSKPELGREAQGLGASGAEWRSTGRSGGADGDEAEGALCPVTRNQSTPGTAPTRRGAKPLL